MKMYYKFGQLFDIIDGDRGINYPKDSDFYEEGYCLFLNAGNVTKNGWSFENNVFITEEKDKQLRNGRVNRGNTVLTTRGTVGNAAYYNDRITYDHLRINSGMVILSAKDNGIIDNEFIYYLVISPIARKTIELFCSGSAQPQLPIKDFVKIKYDLPSIEKQRKTVSILSTYDRLIEINNKRIKVLEQMAENLYKEWFVRFRFPGYETAEFENGLPKGWKTCRFSSIANILSGGTPSTEHDEYYNGEIPFYTPKDSTDNYYTFDTLIHLTEDGLQHCNSPLYPKNTIMITARGTVGNLNLLAVPMAMNQSCYALNSDVIHSQYFLFFLAKNEILKLKKVASGGVFDTIIVKTFDHIKVVIPENDLISLFDRILSPIMDECYKLLDKNRNLTAQRNLLLPRLMSGKLEV